MSSLFGRPQACTTRVTYPSAPVLLQTRGGKESISLKELVVKRCPSVHSEFRPAWWISSGHLQTIYCAIGDFSSTDQVNYSRTFLRLKDGGTLGLDFAPVDDGDMPPDTPIVAIMSGLTGGSYESYVRAVVEPVCRAVLQGGLGYRVVVVNFRGCAGMAITSPQLYSAGHTDDFRQAVFHISKRFPDAPLLGLGFSLGANVMTRYVAEEGENCRFQSACVIACPWNLTENGYKLSSTYVGRFYSRQLGQSLVNTLRKHRFSLTRDPSFAIAEATAQGCAMNWPTLDAFDNVFTRIGGGSSPPWPFASAHDYYVHSSSHKVLSDIRIPLLAINAVDDPIVQLIPDNANDNEWVVMAATPHGGHLGWFESGDSWSQVRRWICTPILQWLRATGEDISREKRKTKELQEVDGYLTEVGSESLGCMVMEKELFVVGAVEDGMTIPL